MKFLIFLVTLFLKVSLFAKVIYIEPLGGHDTQKLFYDPFSYRDEVAKPFCRLREELEKLGYEIRFLENGMNIDNDFDAVICINGASQKTLSMMRHYPKDKFWTFLFEPPVVMPSLYKKSLTNIYGKIFVMLDNMVDNEHYFKFCYPQPRLKMIEGIPDFSEKKLCVIICSNKKFPRSNELYSKRKKAISFFSENHPTEADLFGPGWDGVRIWKGTIPQKWPVLKQYKFCICYENMQKQKGYITEKIFDCFVGGCVPIYLGASNITEYVPKECFIDRRNFKTDEKLYQFLKEMDRDTYEGYLNAIKAYLESPQAQQFSIDHFVSLVTEALIKANQ